MKISKSTIHRNTCRLYQYHSYGILARPEEVEGIAMHWQQETSSEQQVLKLSLGNALNAVIIFRNTFLSAVTISLIVDRFVCRSNLGGEEIAVNVLSSACILSLQQGRQYGPVTVQSVRQAAVFFYEIPVFYLIVQQIVIFK